MNKYILVGTLVMMSLPLLVQASEMTDGPLTQAQIDYILKQNCDSFTGDTKNFCLQMKGRAQIQVRLGKGTQSTDGNISTPPSQTPPPTITANTPPNTQEPKKDLPPPTQQPPRDTPTVSPQPPKNDDMNRAPHQDRTTQPQAPKENHDMSRSTEPSHDGASTRDNHDQKPMLPSPHDGSAMNQPPKDNHDMSKPPHEGISQAVEKLSPADREELMKLIRSFLESKGIQVTLPAQPTPGTNPSTEPVRPTPNTNTITEPTTPTITNPDYQKKSQTRRDKSKRRVTQSTSSSGSFSIDTK